MPTQGAVNALGDVCDWKNGQIAAELLYEASNNYYTY